MHAYEFRFTFDQDFAKCRPSVFSNVVFTVDYVHRVEIARRSLLGHRTLESVIFSGLIGRGTSSAFQPSVFIRIFLKKYI